MYSADMHPVSSPYRCRLCGAASDRRLIHRGADGAMQYSGLYRCSGCSVTFTDPAAWRERLQAETERGATGHITLALPEGPLPYGYSEQDVKGIQEAAARANKSKGRRR